MNLEGLSEKRTQKGTIYYENTAGEITLKVCGKCGLLKLMEDFAKNKAQLGGRNTQCKQCKSVIYEENQERNLENAKKWREENKERHREGSRKWAEANKERKAETYRKWAINNRNKTALKQARRRARLAALPDTLTAEEYSKTLDYFGNACALTGRTTDVEREHAIPLSTGHGGTTFSNCYPMASGLNQSKNDTNIFEWFNANKQRFNLEQWRFDRLIEWLGKANGMTVEEYRAYVYECHANPNAIDEDEAI